MTSPFDSNWHRKSGVTLLETLVVLAVLVIVMAVVSTLRPGISATLSLERTAAARIEEASRLREAAVRTGTETSFRPAEICDRGGPIVFRPDGSASGPDICLSLDGSQLKLELDPLTGRVVAEEARP